MEIRKRKEITVETDEVLVVRRLRIYHAWCYECLRQVDMVQMTDAYTVAGISEDLSTSSQPTGWHVSREKELSLVCLDSVLKPFD